MPLDSYDFKSGTVDTTIDPDTALYFGADSQSDTTPAPQQVQALAAALAIRTETLANKTINTIVRASGNLTVPDGPGTIATVAQLVGAAPTIPDFTAAGTGAVTRTWNNKARDIISVLDYGAVGDGTTDDTAAIIVAIAALTTYQTLWFPPRAYKVNGVLSVTASNVGLHFDNATMLIGDTGTSGTLTNTSVGKIGFLFKNATNLRVTGAVRCIGQGTLGTTSLAGMVFDTCADVQVPCTMYFEKMAAGRMVAWCDRGVFGDVTAKDMNGKQTFQSPPTNTAGTAEVVWGCRYTKFGQATGYDNFKPVRYLSLALTGGGVAIDNDMCTFGPTVGDTGTSPDQSSVLSIRSAKNCKFGSVHSDSMSAGLQFLQYSGDEAWTINGNIVDAVTGRFPSTGASVDSAITQETTSATAMGKNTVLAVSVTVAGEYGILCTAGELSIGHAEVSGGTRCIVAYNCNFNAGKLIVSGSNQEMVTYGQSCNFRVDLIDIRGGTIGGTTAGVRYNTAFGSGGYGTTRIGVISYRFMATNVDLTYVLLDTTNGIEGLSIHHIQGTGSSGQANMVGDVFTVKNGRIASPAIPSAGTYTQGTVIWKTTAASGGTPGWVCTTAGTPGTWSAMANLA